MVDLQSKEQDRQVKGTLAYLAPELVERLNQANSTSLATKTSDPFKSDAFSLGLVVIQFITNLRLSDRLNYSKELYQEIIQEAIQLVRILTNNNGTIVDFLTSSLEFDLNKRKDFLGLLQQQYDAIQKAREAKNLPAPEASTRDKTHSVSHTPITNNTISLSTKRQISRKKSDHSPKRNVIEKNLEPVTNPTISNSHLPTHPNPQINITQINNNIFINPNPVNPHNLHFTS